MMDKNKVNRIKKNQENYGDKKHVKDMTELEQEFLMRKFRSVGVKEWEFTPYSLDRFNKRNIDSAHFMSIWDADTNLIEFHTKKGTNRILLRSSKVLNEYQVCAVLDLTNLKIITIYTNYVHNTHKGLREEFYDASLDVMELYNKNEKKRGGQKR